MPEMDYSYSERQMQQYRRFMHWVKTEGGMELPTQLSTMFQERQIARMNWLKLWARGTVLEVGCNFGLVLAWVGGHCGVDINPANIDLARLLQPDKQFFVADAVTLPFASASYDTVMLPEVLEHLDWPQGVRQAIDEAKRVAKTQILITVPDGREDSADACNFKHLWLMDEQRERQVQVWLPIHTTISHSWGFTLIRGVGELAI